MKVTWNKNKIPSQYSTSSPTLKDHDSLLMLELALRVFLTCLVIFPQLRTLVDRHIAQFALLAVQIMWTLETQTSLEQCRTKKNVMKENASGQILVLSG